MVRCVFWWWKTNGCLPTTLTEGLRNHAMAVDVAYDGDAALDRLAANDYDVIVLDRDLRGRGELLG